MTRDDFMKIYCNAEIQENETFWLIDARTGLGIAEYPKASFTLEEALQDQSDMRIE